jgi:mRNA interferase MazF
MSFPRRGEIYWVNLDPTVGTEIAKTRPALVISNDIGNQHAEHVIVAPISSQKTNQVYPFEVLIPQREGGLRQHSKVLLDQICTLDKHRLGNWIGQLSHDRMLEVDQAVRLSLNV